MLLSTQPHRISFPSSIATECHAVYSPIRKNEQCFHIHVPILWGKVDQLNWGNTSNTVSKDECRKPTEIIEKDGWHERYVEPLYKVTHAMRVGFCPLNPRLQEWAHRQSIRTLLVGDAAHPPVPYVSQGARMGLKMLERSP